MRTAGSWAAAACDGDEDDSLVVLANKPDAKVCSLGCSSSADSEVRHRIVHLIAAAPDFVAATEQMLAYELEGGEGWWKGWEMLRAARKRAICS